MDDLDAMDEPSPEFMAATYVAQIAPLLFDVADQAKEIGDDPQHVAVAEETVTAHIKRQNFDVATSVGAARSRGGREDDEADMSGAGVSCRRTRA